MFVRDTYCLDFHFCLQGAPKQEEVIGSEAIWY